MGPAAVVPHQVMGSELSLLVPLFHCCRPRGTTMGIAVEMNLPSQEPFEVVNVQVPLSEAQREELDQLKETRHKC